ncbi:MAG: PDZ domain-containing protein [Candidatus Liptonbacteria bacterium]|nr:PDZ domain-containing protein [Candidatus Liptonbacteria bacterium]
MFFDRRIRMKKIVVFVTLAALLFVMAPMAMAQEKTKTDGKFPNGWHEAPAAVRAAYLNEQIKDTLDQVSTMKERFAADRSRYPITDDGTLIAMVPRPETTDEKLVAGVLVIGVWKDSPADKNGIAPGDWILAVNGKPICGKASTVTFAVTFTEENASDEIAHGADSCMQNALALANDPKNGSNEFEVERDGKSATYKVGRAEIGRPVGDYMDQNMERWQAVWAASTGELQGLSTELSAAGEDGDRIDVAFLKFLDVGERAAQPVRDLGNFIATQQKRLRALEN